MEDANDTPSTPEPPVELTDRQAFADVFRQFYAPLMRYARGFTKSADSAGDIVQEVFLRLWEKREEITVEVSLKALLYTMVRNRALNLTRDRQKILPDIAVEQAADRRMNVPTQEEEVAADDLRERIYRWVEELPERRAEAFKLSRYHGLRHQEIARIMGISKRTVDTHIYHALEDLRTRLDNLQDESER